MPIADEQKNINLKNVASPSTINSASKDTIGTYYLADNPKYFEPQRSNTFMFYVSGLKGKLNIPYNEYAETNAEEVLKLSVKSSTVPHFTISKSTIKRGNSQMHFAGTPEFDDGTLVVHDYIGAGTKDILLGWQQLAYNVQTEKVGLASDYKLDAYLLEYTPEFQLVRTWILRGCWVSKLSEGNYDNESSDLKTMDVTIVYDKAYIDTSDV